MITSTKGNPMTPMDQEYRVSQDSQLILNDKWQKCIQRSTTYYFLHCYDNIIHFYSFSSDFYINWSVFFDQALIDYTESQADKMSTSNGTTLFNAPKNRYANVLPCKWRGL